MYKISIFIVSLLFSNIYADSLEIGCASITHNKKKECSEDNLLGEKSLYILETLDDTYKQTSKHKVNITKELEGLSIIYQKKKIDITRFAPKDKSCPPYCISPMNIKNIKTIGELEILKFISLLENSKRRLLVDARITKQYKKNTIPTSVNIPYNMLDKNSKHRDEVIKLLKNIDKLLIFDNGILDTQAIKMIDNLINAGYSQKKILYYRGGVKSWKNLGLTTQ
ncbi:MAG TPA: rhodanese-like domain-containing protein [Campylobacterales bacterium]|nr:rhodanese-like domain-containing protein [Campylobacterales bacterium]